MAFFRPMFRMARAIARRPRLVSGLARRIPKFRPRRVYKKKITNKVHRYLRWADKDTLYGTYGNSQILETGANQNLTYQFKLDNVVNPTDFSNLYDSYRINKITLFMEPGNNSTDRLNGPINRKIRVVHDYNDANPLTQEDDYLEYSNCKSYNSVTNRTIKIVLYPKINNVVENVGGAANAFTSMNSNKVWLTLNNTEVPHFGLKMFIPANISTPEGALIYKVRAKFDISFKNSK